MPVSEAVLNSGENVDANKKNLNTGDGIKVDGGTQTLRPKSLSGIFTHGLALLA